METLPHGQASRAAAEDPRHLSSKRGRAGAEQGQSRGRAGQRQQYATLQFGHHRGRAATDHPTAGAYSVNPEKGLAEKSISHGSVKMCL
jgi:hypothetical protein